MSFFLFISWRLHQILERSTSLCLSWFPDTEKIWSIGKWKNGFQLQFRCVLITFILGHGIFIFNVMVYKQITDIIWTVSSYLPLLLRFYLYSMPRFAFATIIDWKVKKWFSIEKWTAIQDFCCLQWRWKRIQYERVAIENAFYSLFITFWQKSYFGTRYWSRIF
jgi:hypothetical protein